jgi:hypothetical protein
MLVRLNRCLIINRWSNDESNSVIVFIECDILLVIDDHVVQNNVSTHDQLKSTLRVKPIRND